MASTYRREPLTRGTYRTGGLHRESSPKPFELPAGTADHLIDAPGAEEAIFEINYTFDNGQTSLEIPLTHGDLPAWVTEDDGILRVELGIYQIDFTLNSVEWDKESRLHRQFAFYVQTDDWQNWTAGQWSVSPGFGGMDEVVLVGSRRDLLPVRRDAFLSFSAHYGYNEDEPAPEFATLSVTVTVKRVYDQDPASLSA